MALRWFGRQVDKAIKQRLATNIRDASELYAAFLRERISVQGPPRSSAGEPPHKDTGELVASIRVDVDPRNLVGQISSDRPYAIVLELGTEGMAARPAWVPTLVEHSDDIAREIVK